MAKKTEEYDLYIKDVYPPPRAKTRYHKKLPDGALPYIGERIKAGQHIENLSAGSAGKLKGLVAIQRRGQGEDRGTLYVVTRKWASENPD